MVGVGWGWMGERWFRLGGQRQSQRWEARGRKRWAGEMEVCTDKKCGGRDPQQAPSRYGGTVGSAEQEKKAYPGPLIAVPERLESPLICPGGRPARGGGPCCAERE